MSGYMSKCFAVEICTLPSLIHDDNFISLSLLPSVGENLLSSYWSGNDATPLAIPSLTHPLRQVVRVLPDPVLCYTN